MLPQPTAKILNVTNNPCIPLTELADTVLALVPAEDKHINLKRAAAFRLGVHQISSKVLAVNAAAECAYQTDRLAVAIYQQPDYLWSVGVAAVIRGDIGAAVDVTFCYVTGIPLPTSIQPRQAAPAWQLCTNMTRPTKNGEVYTVLTAGDSDVMCKFLRQAG